MDIKESEEEMNKEQDSRVHILGHKPAFTMAEILISLTIIGIIAAITLPALQANINEKTWATKRKALYSRMSQAIPMLPSLNGYGVVFNNDGTINGDETANKAAQAFISDGLSKVLKINNICDNSNINKCGFPDQIAYKHKEGRLYLKLTTPQKLTDINPLFNMGQYSENAPVLSYSQIDTKTAAFETVNGESILTFYNPNCSYNTVGAFRENNYYKDLIQPTMCVNFIYDLNGKKGPNKLNADIGFMTVFYPTDSAITSALPLRYIEILKSKYPDFSIGIANSVCRQKYGNDSRVANIEELKSLFVNRNLGLNLNNGFVSSTPASSTTLYMLRLYAGDLGTVSKDTYGTSNYHDLMCVK